MDADLFTPIPRKTLLGVPCSALFGDCLDVMQGMDSETVDLIYIDPPYYSQADYKGDAGAFSDKWESMHQYLNWMVVRLYEMKRLLKPTGSIYLHCDWHASHYLKVEMDKIMGGECFLNDVAWLYGLGGSSPRYWPRKHDSLLWYAKQTGKHYFIADMIPATSSRMAGEMKKAPDFWDIPAVNNMAKERNGYPTQKPEALLERVIRSSCPEGGTVADFFCGSGTTAVVAQRMGRNWITCDKSQDAINLATKRIFSLPNAQAMASADTQTPKANGTPCENPSPTNRRRRIVHPRIVRPLPCPHCGADAELKRYQHDNSRVYYGCSMPRCSYTYTEEKDALAAWNRRELSWELEHSARYILEDANPEKLAEACGLPLGVIVAALENILPNIETQATTAKKLQDKKP